MTDSEFNIYVRSLINESTAVFWSDEDLASYKAVAIALVNGQFWNFLYPLRRKFELKSLSAGNRYLTLPADCQKPFRLEWAETGDKINYIQDEWFYVWANQVPGDPNGWTLVESQIYLFPVPGSTQADALRFWYLPRATTLADLPAELHPLIAIEAVMAAKTKDDNVSASLERRHQRFYNAAVKALIIAQGQDPEIVGEVTRYEDPMDI